MVVRQAKVGLVRQSYSKADKSNRTTPLPVQAVEFLGCRHELLGEFTDLWFPTPLMVMADSSNVQRAIREVRDDLGYPAFSTHSCRKTVATLPDRAGMSATEIADHLVHANPSLTLDVYMNTAPDTSSIVGALGAVFAPSSSDSAG